MHFVGVGDRFAKYLPATDYKGCKCKDMREKMNNSGHKWCRRSMGEIIHVALEGLPEAPWYARKAPRMVVILCLVAALEWACRSYEKDYAKEIALGMGPGQIRRTILGQYPQQS